MADLFTGCSKLAEVTLGESFVWVGSKCFLPQPDAALIPGADGLWHAASDRVSYPPSAVPCNKADTYRAVAPGGGGDAADDDSDSASGAGGTEDAGNVGRADDVDAANGADGESAPNGESSAIAAGCLAAAGREDYMTALAMANPSAAAPSVVA